MYLQMKMIFVVIYIRHRFCDARVNNYVASTRALRYAVYVFFVGGGQERG